MHGKALKQSVNSVSLNKRVMFWNAHSENLNKLIHLFSEIHLISLHNTVLTQLSNVFSHLQFGTKKQFKYIKSKALPPGNVWLFLSQDKGSHPNYSVINSLCVWRVKWPSRRLCLESEVTPAPPTLICTHLRTNLRPGPSQHPV